MNKARRTHCLRANRSSILTTTKVCIRWSSFGNSAARVSLPVDMVSFPPSKRSYGTERWLVLVNNVQLYSTYRLLDRVGSLLLHGCSLLLKLFGIEPRTFPSLSTMKSSLTSHHLVLLFSQSTMSCKMPMTPSSEHYYSFYRL